VAVVAALILALIVIVTFGGCAGRQPVDTSQTILAEAASALAVVDAAVADAATATEEEAIDRAVARVDAEECEEGEGRESCVVRHLRDERSAWYRAADALEAAHAVLETWEQANDAWRSSGERPPDWLGTVCRPFDTAITAVLDLLPTVDVDVPELWRNLLSRVDLVCQVGGALVTSAASEEGAP